MALWYVDKDAAGTNAGTSWANAWTSFASVVWGGSGVVAGDTLYISGGATSKTYTETWSVGASGSSGSPITIVVDAGNASHNGTVIFDHDALGDESSATAITIINRSYITINGEVSGQRRISIRNLRNIYTRTNANAIFGYGNSTVRILYVAVDNCNNGVRLYSGSVGSGSEVAHCAFTNMRGDVSVMLQMGSSSSFGVHSIHHNTIESLSNDAQPPGAPYAYVGPDGIQPGDGTSIHDNTIRVTSTVAVYTSDQHPDGVQCGLANYLKIYNNEFVNVGDSCIDIAPWVADYAMHDIWMYNNVFRIEEAIDPYPQFIRLYSNPGNIASITNVKIMNNLFLDSPANWPAVIFSSYGGNPTASGCEIKNNIFYNTQGLEIIDSTGFDGASFSFANNVYYPSTTSIKFDGSTYTPTQWQAIETTAKITAPSFVSYSANNPSNNLHLSGSDTVAKDGGVSLSSYFTTDKDGNARSGTWDIGPYEYGALLGGPQNVRWRPV